MDKGEKLIDKANGEIMSSYFNELIRGILGAGLMGSIVYYLYSLRYLGEEPYGIIVPQLAIIGVASYCFIMWKLDQMAKIFSEKQAWLAQHVVFKQNLGDKEISKVDIAEDADDLRDWFTYISIRAKTKAAILKIFITPMIAWAVALIYL